MTLTKIINEIKQLKSVLIFSHNRPDGDTIGSATALYYALTSLGIKCDLCCESDIPPKYSFIKAVALYKKSKEYLGTILSYDGAISVDCSAEMMFSDAYSLFAKAKKRINIDHHISNTRYAQFNYVENCGACAEIMCGLIEELGVEITNDIANSLMLGIVTDTGAFAHSNVTPNTLLISSKLLSNGADLHGVIEKMFKTQPRERAELHAKTMSKIRYELDGKLAITVITRKDLLETGADDSMTEGFIDFPLSVSGVEVAISILETADKRYKISFRSKGKVNVNEIASIYGGGGHVLASGAVLNGYLEDIIDKLTYNVSQRL